MTRQRKTLAMFGPSRGGVRVLVERGGELVRVQWYDDGIRRVKSWPNTREGRTEAKAWARGHFEARTLGPRPTVLRLTLRELWERYVEAEFPHLCPKTQTNYREHWSRWELFLRRDFTADEARLGDVDHFRAALERQDYALSQIHKAIGVVKTVYNRGQRRELLGMNRLALYRFKVAKDRRSESPAEYTHGERDAILQALRPRPAHGMARMDRRRDRRLPGCSDERDPAPPVEGSRLQKGRDCLARAVGQDRPRARAADDRRCPGGPGRVEAMARTRWLRGALGLLYAAPSAMERGG